VPGPLLPAASAEVWIGGTSERVARSAARVADAWNGWGMSIDAFEVRAGELAAWAREAGREPAEVPPTWAGIVPLVPTLGTPQPMHDLVPGVDTVDRTRFAHLGFNDREGV